MIFHRNIRSNAAPIASGISPVVFRRKNRVREQLTYAGEHARSDLRWYQGQGDLRHIGHLHPLAFLWRLGVLGESGQGQKLVEKANKGGVPMGGDLPKRTSKKPKFAVWALKDPGSGHLDRIQIVKGWFEHGYAFEKVYDMAWADAAKRKVGVDGPGFQPAPPGCLLRARDLDPDAALDDLRCCSARHRPAYGCGTNDPGARLVLTDLVHASTEVGGKAGPLIRSATVFALIATFRKRRDRL